MRIINKIKILLLTVVFATTSCLELDIRNGNDPDIPTVLADPGNLTQITSSVFYGVFRGYFTNANFYSINSSLEWTADHTTMTNNVLSWWAIFKQEPRQPLTNLISWPNKQQILEPWNSWNGVVVNANTIIRTLESQEGELSDELKGLLGTIYFCRAMALGYIGITFDQGYIVPVNSENYTPAFVPYDDIIDEALVNFDIAADIFDEVPGFVLPAEILNNLGYSSADMKKLCRTYYLHFAVSSARNSAQNAQTDWTKVRDYALEGITQDFIVDADGDNFIHALQYGSGIDWYFRVDHRVMRLFNSNLPKRFPDMQAAPTSPYTEDFLKGAGYNGDKRLDAYFKFEPSLSFYNASRNNGTLRSHYRIKRYDPLFAAQGIGASVVMYSYTNDLYLAEAYVRLGNLDGAIAILNDPSNPRKAVGEMPDLPTGTLTADEILEIIYAERDIELGRTEYALPWLELRRRDALQVGTLLHLPVPADELTTLGLPIYTFGGVDAADGENTADGSNSWIND